MNNEKTSPVLFPLLKLALSFPLCALGSEVFYLNGKVRTGRFIYHCRVIISENNYA
jgi:hypothetical protein